MTGDQIDAAVGVLVLGGKNGRGVETWSTTAPRSRVRKLSVMSRAGTHSTLGRVHALHRALHMKSTKSMNVRTLPSILVDSEQRGQSKMPAVLQNRIGVQAHV